MSASADRQRTWICDCGGQGNEHGCCDDCGRNLLGALCSVARMTDDELAAIEAITHYREPMDGDGHHPCASECCCGLGRCSLPACQVDRLLAEIRRLRAVDDIDTSLRERARLHNENPSRETWTAFAKACCVAFGVKP